MMSNYTCTGRKVVEVTAQKKNVLLENSSNKHSNSKHQGKQILICKRIKQSLNFKKSI